MILNSVNQGLLSRSMLGKSQEALLFVGLFVLVWFGCFSLLAFLLSLP
jgi:hypothetical protein